MSGISRNIFDFWKFESKIFANLSINSDVLSVPGMFNIRSFNWDGGLTEESLVKTLVKTFQFSMKFTTAVVTYSR